MTIPDTCDAVRDYLANDSGVSALTGSSVYPHELASNLANTNARYSILVRPTGSVTQSSDVKFMRQRFDVWCYADTPKDSFTLYGAVHGAMRAMARNVSASTLLYSATQSGGPLDGRMVETLWPFTWSSWIINISEETI